MIDINFWKNKKILISGHTGFKGTWLSLLLKNLGAEIEGISSSSFRENTKFFDLISRKINMKSYDLDIRNYQDLEDNFKNKDYDIFFHMAAQPLVRRSYESPLETFNINAIGTLNFMELVRNYQNIKSSIMITTDKCYENKELDISYKETDRMGGHDPYSASKACAELIISSYQRSFFNEKKTDLGLCSVRAGNVIGGGDFSEDRLVPDIIRASSSSSLLSIRNPNSTRPWQHVLDPLIGYLEIGQRSFNIGSSFNSSWNFGPCEADIRTVGEVVETSKKYLPDNFQVLFEQADHAKHEANLLRLDINKALSQLKWKPILNFDFAIKITMDWYDQFLRDEDMFAYTNQQINEFIKICNK